MCSDSSTAQTFDNQSLNDRLLVLQTFDNQSLNDRLLVLLLVEV